jgi:Tfp pilus assembly protein PilF
MKNFYSFIIRSLLILLIGFSPAYLMSQDEEQAEETAKQTRKEKRANFSKYGFIGISGGVSLNHTDLSEKKWLPPTETWKLGLSAFGGWQFHPIWGVRGQFTVQNLYGFTDDQLIMEKYGFEGARFEANTIDYSLQLKINIFNLLFGYKDRAVEFFGTAGVGWTEWQTLSYERPSGNPWRKNGYDGADKDIPVVEGYGSGESWFGNRTRVVVVPASLGFNFHVAPKWDIQLESQWKWVDSDRLDTWVDGAAAVKEDMYSYTSLGIQYRIGGGDPLKRMEKEYETVAFVEDPDPMEAHGGTVKVKVTGTFPEKYFHPKAAMKFTPYVKYDGGEYPLKTVVLKGEDVAGEGILIPNGGGTFVYEDEFPYQEGFKVSELMVEPIIFLPKEALGAEVPDEQIEGYKNITLPETKLADGVITTGTRFSNDEIPLIAFHGYEKETILTEAATIFFYVNRHDLNWRVPLNKLDANKQRLDDLADFLRLGYDIKDINIDGWASPEGEETFNEGLSERRTNTAFKYMQGKVNKLIKEQDSKMMIESADDITFNLAHHGPDWNGFLRLVGDSKIQDKNMILNVVNSAGTPAKKEQEIRNMIVIYPELEEDILPPLRRAEIVVNCYQPKKTDQEIANLGLSNPRGLDDKELLYSATLTEDDDEKLSIYKAAINNYPDNYRGYVNAATIEIKQGDLAAAKTHLEKAISLEPNSGEAFNNMGIVYAMEGDMDKAEENFLKAQELGEDVNYNLGIVMISKGEYTKAKALMAGKSCEYNLGLLQILNEEYDAAEETLGCAPKDADTYYLWAVLGARTDNKDMVLEGLTEAIKADESLKAEAAIDREFIEYFEDEDFKMLVQ